MTRPVADIKASIAALELELKAATEAANAEAKAVAADFSYDYDWALEWPHPAQFRVSRTATADTAQRILDFRARFPLYCMPPKPFEGGMTYSVLIGTDGGFYVDGGGGAIIVRPSGDDSQRYSFTPEPISTEWLAELRDGRIPEGMKR